MGNKKEVKAAKEKGHEKREKLPNFFIVGAAKSGTTSLYHHLCQHPDVFMSPVKEPHYFSKDIWHYLIERGMRDVQKNYNDYKKLFKDGRAIGEASPSYLYSKVAAREIYNFNPDAKIIIILRNPVNRAFSAWRMNCMRGIDGDLFIKEIKKINNYKNSPWKTNGYLGAGMYSSQIKRYMDIFPRKNILILYFYDLKKNPEKVMGKIFRFLGVKQIKIKDIDKKYNEGGMWRWRFIGRMLRFGLLKNPMIMLWSTLMPEKGKIIILSFITSKKENLPKMTDEERGYLEKVYNKEVPRLNKLLGKANVKKLMSVDG